MQFKLI